MRRDGKRILEDFTFALNPGDRAVLIGEEGNGKSTLLKLIADPAAAGYADFTGVISLGGSRPGYLEQELPAADAEKSVCDYLSGRGLLDADPKRTAAVARQLGVSTELLWSDQRMGTLSGGEKVKVRMAAILLSEPDLLLLDEPTNDLDLDTLAWFEEFLLNCGLPALYVSHDETLIERTANVIIHIEQVRKKTVCRHTVARTGYREYVESRASALAHQEQVARKEQADHRRQMERWHEIYDKVDRAQKNLTRQDPHSGRLLKKKMASVKATGARLEREHAEATQIPDVEDAILLEFASSALPRGKRVLEYRLDTLTVGERILARNVALNVTGGEHVGVVGKNGAGKTTLLRLLAEELLGRTDLRAAYMPQNYADALDAAITPIEYLAPALSKDQITAARTYLGSVRFTHEEMEGKIGELSGGQRAKLFFVKMALDRPDVLLLDEPTRNFSPLSGPVIRGVLSRFGGAILTVTHDRKYLSEVCERVYELTPEGLEARKP